LLHGDTAMHGNGSMTRPTDRLPVDGGRAAGLLGLHAGAECNSGMGAEKKKKNHAK
jgi:hypothetical protein